MLIPAMSGCCYFYFYKHYHCSVTVLNSIADADSSYACGVINVSYGLIILAVDMIIISLYCYII